MTKTEIYRDATLSIHERVSDLLSKMTIREKIGQMMQLDARAGVTHLIHDFHVGSILHTSPRHLSQAYKETERTRLKIPLLVGEDCIHGHSFQEGATIFPTQLAMAASWNPGLVEKVARVTAIEASVTGIHWTFSPVLCIARDLRWGRVGETFGEDPHLIGEFALAMVRGYQGDGPNDPTAMIATAKHFAGYSETQGGRDASEADISQRKLRSWFLPPFEKVARAGCRTFMLGYQTMDGVPITLNDWLLTDVLRGEWGYKGTLITDWDNVGRMVWEQRIQPDYSHAAAAAVKAGNDMIMTTPGFFEGALSAIENGLLEEPEIDRAVERILRLKMEYGLFENPRHADFDRASIVLSAEEHIELNKEIARESLVLLKNDGILPLSDKQRLKVGVVGPLADDAQGQLGDWAGNSGQVDWLPNGHKREQIITVLDGLRERIPNTWDIHYARGADIVEFAESESEKVFEDGQPRPTLAKSAPIQSSDIMQVREIVEKTDIQVAVVGDTIALIGEGRSTATLELLGGQKALLEVLQQSNKPYVLVLMASKPHVLDELALDANAIIWAANPGMVGGQAISELLFGDFEPVGRLPISFPKHVGQQPCYYNQIRGQHNDRYADLDQKPQFAFGQGLSFTTVQYSDLRLDKAQYRCDESLRALVSLTNTGGRSAIETVQFYVSDVVTSASWVDRELKAFVRTELQPGETKQIELEVPVSEFSIVDARGKRIVEPGEFMALVGPDSREESLLKAPFAVIV